MVLVRNANTIMGGLCVGVADYVRQFGLLDNQHRFGDQVWIGLRQLFMSYPYSYRLVGGMLSMGWFQAPHNFGRASSQMPVDPHRDTLYYPACFVIWSDTDNIISMACEAILLQSSRPWRVHRTRMVNARPAAEIDFCVLN